MDGLEIPYPKDINNYVIDEEVKGYEGYIMI